MRPNGAPTGQMRIPPQFLEGERAILGSLLLDNRALARVTDIVEADDFYREAHRTIYAAMCELHERNEPVDWMTLTAILEKQGELESVGGHGFLAELSNAVPSAANVMHYVKVVRERAFLRRVIGETSEIQAMCWGSDANPEQIQEQLQSAAFEVMRRTQEKGQGPRHVKEVLSDRISHLGQRRGGTGIMSGLTNLDKFTMGFRRGDFVIIGGRPSQGKTSILTDIIQAAVQQTAAMVFSIEMGDEQYVDRHLAKVARINLQYLRPGSPITEEEHRRVVEAAAEIAEYPLVIDPSPAITVSQMKARIRDMSLRTGLRFGLVAVDYFQLMMVERSMQKDQGTPKGYSSISNGLKRMAKELDVVLVVLSQLSRKVEDRPRLGGKDKKQHMRIPILSDLRDTGSLEQDGDVIIFMYRPGYYSSTEDQSVALAVVAKQRNGPIGIAELTWRPEICTFQDRVREREQTQLEKM